MKQIPVITGPTASGKTDLALQLAASLGNVEIISADSRQIYIGMDIGTAKPSPAQRAVALHHLIDILRPDQAYSAGRFAQDARLIIDQVIARGNVPVIAGGSGFYIHALFYGLKAPTADPAIYAVLQQRMATEGYDALYQELLSVDPPAARAHSPNNQVKTLRALACWTQTGMPYSSFTDDSRSEVAPYKYQPSYLLTDIPRQELYQRINQRALDMMKAGLIAETSGLLQAGYTQADPGMRTVGYREVVAYLGGEYSLERATELIQQSTRRYAKRQITWFRTLAEEAARLHTPDQFHALEWIRSLHLPADD